MKLYRGTLFLALSAALGMVLVAIPRFASAQSPAPTLVISKVEPLPLEGSDVPKPHSLYDLVEVHFSKAWMEVPDSAFKVTLDSQPATVEWIGNGFADDAERDFYLYPGTAGRKQLQVSLTVDGKTLTARKELTVTAAPLIRLLNHVPYEGVFENPTLTFMVFEAKNPVVTVNDKQVAAEAKPSDNFPGIALLTLTPSLRPGTNRIEVAAEGPGGERVLHTSTLFFAANNTVKVGDKFNLVWGHMGSRSGPFFHLESTQKPLAITSGPTRTPMLSLDAPRNGTPGGWILPDQIFTYAIAAELAGKSELRFEEQGNWMIPSRVAKTVPVTIVP